MRADAMSVWKIGSSALAAALVLSSLGCVAGPQPEPPMDPRDAGRMVPDPPGPPPLPGVPAVDAAPAPAADAGAAAPPSGADAGPAFMGESPPWLDPSDSAGARDDDVAPFPFEPCCGWFVLPDADAGSGTEADAGADAGADADAGEDADTTDE